MTTRYSEYGEDVEICDATEDDLMTVLPVDAAGSLPSVTDSHDGLARLLAGGWLPGAAGRRER